MANEKRLIDAKEYCKELYEEMNYPGRSEEFMMAIDVAIADLADAPTVDAVEVCRCKDCSYAKDMHPLIANGVTIADDVSAVAYNLSPTEQKWIPVTERLPKNFVSVLGYMTDAGGFPPVRECYTIGNAFFFPALGDKHPVSHWMEIPEPPKEVE